MNPHSFPRLRSVDLRYEDEEEEEEDEEEDDDEEEEEEEEEEDESLCGLNNSWEWRGEERGEMRPFWECREDLAAVFDPDRAMPQVRMVTITITLAHQSARRQSQFTPQQKPGPFYRAWTSQPPNPT